MPSADPPTKSSLLEEDFLQIQDVRSLISSQACNTAELINLERKYLGASRHENLFLQRNIRADGAVKIVEERIDALDVSMQARAKYDALKTSERPEDIAALKVLDQAEAIYKTGREVYDCRIAEAIDHYMNDADNRQKIGEAARKIPSGFVEKLLMEDDAGGEGLSGEVLERRIRIEQVRKQLSNAVHDNFDQERTKRVAVERTLQARKMEPEKCSDTPTPGLPSKQDKQKQIEASQRKPMIH